MVSAISSWAQSIVIAVFVSTILEMIIPDGKCKKYIKVVIGIYIVFVIISPIIKKVSGKDFLQTDFDIDKYLTQNSIEVVTNLEEQNNKNIKQIYEDKLKQDIINKLKNQGFLVKRVNLEISQEDEEYKIEKIILTGVKEETDDNKNENEDEKEYINEILIDIKTNDEIEKKEEAETTINMTKKSQIRLFLSQTYDVSRKNIQIE